MIRSGRLLGTVGAFALAVLGASPALASGTLAGSSIVNNVTVNFQVGGVAQTASAASNTFVVDRKVNMTVAEVGTTTTQVSPGQLAAVTTFTVTNTSNATLDFALAAVNGAAAHGGTDNFDVSNIKIYVDTNGDGTFNAGDTLVTYLDELAADATKTVFVVADVPLSLNTNDVAGVVLTATAREGGASGSQGVALSQSTGADNAAVMDTVFADGAGATDGSRDAAYSARDDYTVSAAALSVSKQSRIVSDPVNLTVNPKAIPGATVEYCIVVANAAGSATATSVAISDPLPATVTYDSSFGVLMGGSVTSGTCNADGTNTGTQSAGTVSGTIASVAAGQTKTMLFRATIQ